MPSEQLAALLFESHHRLQGNHLPAQTKICSFCHLDLDPSALPATAFFLAEPLVCTICRDRGIQGLAVQGQHDRPDHRPRRVDIDVSSPVFVRPLPSHEGAMGPLASRRHQVDVIAQPVYEPPSPAPSVVPLDLDDAFNFPSRSPTASPHGGHKPILAQHSVDPAPVLRHCSDSSPVFVPDPPQEEYEPLTPLEEHHDLPVKAAVKTLVEANPLLDITYLRVRSRAHHCIYPGATFKGTQKSGRNSYDVHVTIVDVNFDLSVLCGYLRICGLTDDWPELTTYFDAEIIGNRYGFLTQNWGASPHEDLVHWSRFPAFKHIRDEAKRPHMTLDDRDRGVIFMRWKERFLVPDHRVQDINGASFAGFYYVCVDFSPQPSASTSAEEALDDSEAFLPSTHDERSESRRTSLPHMGSRTKSKSRARRDSSIRRRETVRAPAEPPLPIMSGFYFHHNSEPYQQLSLTYVPESTSSSFEFR